LPEKTRLQAKRCLQKKLWAGAGVDFEELKTSSLTRSKDQNLRLGSQLAQEKGNSKRNNNQKYHLHRSQAHLEHHHQDFHHYNHNITRRRHLPTRVKDQTSLLRLMAFGINRPDYQKMILTNHLLESSREYSITHWMMCPLPSSG
jgi:hypothetical protein